MDLNSPTPHKPLRLWPGVLVVALQWLIMFGLPLIVPGQGGTAIVAGFVGGLVVMLWWLFFSRAPWLERLGVIVVMVVAVAATSRLVHESIANGMMGFMPFVYAFPLLSLALVVSAVVSRGLSIGRRRVSMVTAIVLACGVLTLLRTGGLTGDAESDVHWRWTPTPEERLLAEARNEAEVRPAAPAPSTPESPSPAPARAEPVPPVAAPTAAKAESPSAEIPAARATSDRESTRGEGPAMSERRLTRVEWPGFRGPGRDSTIAGLRVETDWAKSPPVELWRRPVGPGWSSFAVSGAHIFTQEQRGDDEMVSAYSLKTGEPVWRHRDAARFWESNAGPGPRATPTLSNGRVYTLGGTGILNVLDARDGAVVWSRNAASDTGRKVPDWGIASSPLIVGDVVIVAAAGWLAAYDAATGKPRWFGPKDGYGYSSPQLSTIGGVEQVVLVNGPGAIGVAPSDGTVLWKYEWAGDSIVQPAVIAGGDLLIGSGSGIADKTGMLRVNVAHGPLDRLGAGPVDGP